MENRNLHIAGISRALGDESRLRIMELLVEKEYCVGALARRLGCSEAAVSQHLKILRLAGLVRGEKRGYWVHYSACTENIVEFADSLKAFVEAGAKTVTNSPDTENTQE